MQPTGEICHTSHHAHMQAELSGASNKALKQHSSAVGRVSHLIENDKFRDHSRVSVVVVHVAFRTHFFSI